MIVVIRSTSGQPSRLLAEEEAFNFQPAHPCSTAVFHLVLQERPRQLALIEIKS
jgi:hypothetical protein